MAYMYYKMCIMNVILEVCRFNRYDTRSVENRDWDAAELNPRSILPRIDRFELIWLALNIEASDFQHPDTKRIPGRRSIWTMTFRESAILVLGAEVWYLHATLQHAGRKS